MKRIRYPAEFKAEAVKQVSERGHGVVDEGDYSLIDVEHRQDR
jgi:hypothetical protein